MEGHTGDSTGDPEEWVGLGAWCLEHLGAAPVATLFSAGHLSRVVGVRLAASDPAPGAPRSSGAEVVCKVRPADGRTGACLHVQRRLADAGYPCPRPLAGPSPLAGPGRPGTERGSGLVVTAEEYLPGGEVLDAGRPGAAGLVAGALAWLVSLAPPPGDVPGLAPPPPWVGWDHGGAGVWPVPDEPVGDLDAVSGPAWLDDAARRVRDHLCTLRLRGVVGHADFEAHNLRWGRGDERVRSRAREGSFALRAVHDWDSVAVRPEAALAGAAADVHTASGAPATEAGIGRTGEFLACYERARGRAFDPDEHRAAWSAGLWVRLFNAKKQVARGERADADRLAAEVDERLRRALP